MALEPLKTEMVPVGLVQKFVTMEQRPLSNYVHRKSLSEKSGRDFLKFFNYTFVFDALRFDIHTPKATSASIAIIVMAKLHQK